jgi:hypothetical protein
MSTDPESGPPPTPDYESLDFARGLVRGLVDDPSARGPLSRNAFGKLFAFGDELRQLQNFQSLITTYVAQAAPKRPLCLAVFGPPGSGKSFAVKQVVAGVPRPGPEIQLPLVEVNLTQVAHPGELGRVLARIAGEQDKNTVPVVFFDEFDAARGGARFGWLGWFLAPMNDGVFLHEGALVRLQRAVYVFAGGTASTFAEFAEPAAIQSFRFAKGPDFVSRLRGVLEVRGPNNPPRLVRRALILRHELRERLPKDAWAGFKVDDALLDSLLTAGRYRHGSRSIAALVEMSRFGLEAFTHADLPSADFLAMHVDRGPLDPRRIGGSIALSGKIPTAGDDDGFRKLWRQLAQRLWDEGATLSYAGKWDTGEELSLARKLLEELSARPAELSAPDPPDGPGAADGAKTPRAEKEPRFRTFGVAAAQDEAGSSVDAERIGVKLHRVAAAETLPAGSRHRKVVEDLRRRLDSTECSVARFAVGGLTEGYDGRMPGVAEEVMLSLASGHPVYVAGGFGGVAADVGMLLGLSRTRTGEIPPSMLCNPGEDLSPVTRELRPPPRLDLPITACEAAAALQRHALGGTRWPDNGLSRDDNRRLFETDDPQEVVRLVAAGLLRRFGAYAEVVTSLDV